MENHLDIVAKLELLPHPEGGFYKEVFRSAGAIPATALPLHTGKRNYITSIYFLITEGNFSAFHKISSDEVWYFHTGDDIEILELDQNSPNGFRSTILGHKSGVYQYTVKAETIFGSRVYQEGKFSLVSCAVAPGFDFEDFVMPSRDELNLRFPSAKQIIEQLTRI